MTAGAKVPATPRFLYTNGLCLIGDQSHRCVCIKQHHVINQIPVAEVTLVPDPTVKGLDADLPALYTSMFSTKKGDSVLVSFNFTATPDATISAKALSNETVVVFRGVLLGWAPVWLGPTTFRMVAYVIHPLGMLDWASTIIDPIQGSGFDDYKVPTVVGKYQELVPYMKGGYTDKDVETDIWGKLIKPELINICKAGVFGATNSQTLVDYLEDKNNVGNDGSEQPLSYKLSNPKKVILDVRRRLYNAGVGRRSLWDVLVELAGIYKFSIVCRSLDYSIAPILYALGGTPPLGSTVFWWKFVQREDYNALVRDIAQSTGLLRGTGGAPGFFDTESRRRQKTFRTVPEESVTAGTDYFMVPRFLDFDGEPFFNTGNSMGLKTDKILASGYTLDEPPGRWSPLSVISPNTKSLNEQYNTVPLAEMKAYADLVQNDRAYSGPTAVLKGNVDYSRSPGNMVYVEPPMRYKVNDAVSDMYFANIWGVTHILDSTNADSVGTYMILSHIRSTSEQGAIVLERHPLYDKRWMSSPLVKIAGFTEEPHYA